MDDIRPEENTDGMYWRSGANPARDAAEITPNDATEYVPRLRALRIGTGGNVVVMTARGSLVTFVNVQDGETIPLECIKVMATNTTATNIVGYFG